ncbi:MAG: glycosyltransferase [Oscillospiraceae bacterium]|nr:glycosyltransferase [Oscillospiraceae bacterium]MBQ3542500.1 glycosyltransferase [Oscillospiraceae bacterium]
MKILITTDLYTTSTNGVVTSVRNLMEELTKKGHEIRVLTVSEKLKSHTDGNIYYIKSLPLGAIYPDVRMPVSSHHHRFIQELIDWKPDLIHSQCEFFSYQYAGYISRKTGAPIVHTYHTLYEQYVTYIFPSQRIGAFFVGKLSKYRLRKADAVVAPTAKVETVLKNYGLRNPVHVVPSGIALEQHKQRITEKERKRRRRELGIPEDALVLLNLGRLGTEKNLTEVVEFFAMARSQNSKLILLIVGDGPARKELEETAHRLAVKDFVIFTGMVAPEEVHAFYQLGDVFVSASTSETQGLTYVEAAANGLPLLCRRDPCLDDVLVEGRNGYEYEAEDEFCQLLDTILQNPDWCRTAGTQSAQIAATFDKSHFAEKIEDVYEAVLQ